MLHLPSRVSSSDTAKFVLAACALEITAVNQNNYILRYMQKNKLDSIFFITLHGVFSITDAVQLVLVS